MKTGKAVLEVVSVICPECDECWYGTPHGSSGISADSDMPKAGQVVECFDCGSKFRMPGILKKLGV